MSWHTLSQTKPRARNDYRCVWCNEIIPTDTVHEKIAGLFEGEFQSSRLHLECAEANTRWFHEWGENSFYPGEFKRGTTEPK